MLMYTEGKAHDLGMATYVSIEDGVASFSLPKAGLDKLLEEIRLNIKNQHKTIPLKLQLPNDRYYDLVVAASTWELRSPDWDEPMPSDLILMEFKSVYSVGDLTLPHEA